MKKLIATFVMMSLFSVACNKSDGGTSDKKTDEPVATSPVVTSPPVVKPPVVITPPVVKPPVVVTPPANTNLPALASSFSTNIVQVNFTAAQEAKYNKAIAIVKLVVGTEAFRDQVLNFTYAGKKAFIDNKGKTNAQIYQSILDAAETLQPAKNNRMDLEVELYYAANTVVGYTNGGTKRIWVNTKFFNSYKENSVAGNLFHEWLHKLGYGHAYASTPTRPYSVPYAIGSMMGNIGKKFL